MSSCTDDIPGLKRDLSLSGNVLSIPFQVESEMPLSRSESAAIHERTVKNAYIMFFNSEDNMIAYRTIGIPSGSASLSFDVPETVQQGTDYNTLVLGNAEEYLPNGYTTVNSYLDTFIGKSRNNVMTTIAATIDDLVTSRYPGVLPFYGKYVDKYGNEVPFNYTRNDVGFTVNGEFWFSRAICRIDINNLVPGLLDIKYAKVCNYRDESPYFKDGTTMGRVIPLERASNAPAGDGSDGYMPSTDVAGESGNVMSQRLRESLYALPNAVNTTVQNDKVTTCLIIAGYYTENGEKDTELTYYRFNLANPGEPQLMNRNFVYRAVIKGVNRRGHATDFDAYNDGNPIFEYDVDDEWDADDDNFVTDGKGNFLIVSKSHLTFQGSANEADKVELRISTSPELSWRIEWDNSQPNHSNGSFTCEKLTDQAIKVGPTDVNDTPYVRYGYFYIVAENKSTGVSLKLRIYLQQLSLLYNVKTLTVNGATGRVEAELPPEGGTIMLKVVTGATANRWKVTEPMKNFLSTFGTTATYSEEGGNNSYLKIYVEPNITTDTRTATLQVALNPSDDKVSDVIVELVQEKSSQMLVVSPWPENDILYINAFVLEDKNLAGVINPKWFNVTLADPKNYRYKVTSTFDKYRDLKLSTTSLLDNTAYKGIQPAASKECYDDIIEGRENGQQFWINPYRMGPDDPSIEGKIVITAYNPDDASARTETREFTVILERPEIYMGDILFMTPNGGIAIFPDRSIGMTPRVIEGQEKPNVATYYTYQEHYKTSAASILPSNTGFMDNLPAQWYAPNKNPKLIGPKTNNPVYDFLDEQKDENEQFSNWYKTSLKDRWAVMTVHDWTVLVKNNIQASKGRVFAYSKFGKIVNGTEIPVCCWIHQACKPTAYNSNMFYQHNDHGERYKNSKSVYLSSDYKNFIYLNENDIYVETTYDNFWYPYVDDVSYSAICRPIMLFTDNSEANDYGIKYLGQELIK